MAHEDATREDGAPNEAAPAGPGRITRVVLKNYKSIVSCDVELQPLTILVGPNGSGKSNFLDALAFVAQALTVGLDQAIRNRGNLDRILSAARPPGNDSFSIAVHFTLSGGNSGLYSFKILRTADGAFRVQGERLQIEGTRLRGGIALFSFDADSGAVWRANEVPDHHRFARDRLYLVNYSAIEEARPAYDLLTSMAFYNPLPDVMRPLERRDAAPRLLTDGANVASMVQRMQDADPELVWGITQYMKRVLPGLETIATVDLAGRDLLRFSVRSGDEAAPLTFDADQMSDGTLRALAILVALFQGRLGGKSVTSLVGIEEPENTLHPAAGGALANALIDVSYDGQVLVTTHSTSLLDGDEIDASSLLAVVVEDGVTRIGPVDAVSRSILKDHLYTAGELLQMDQMRPEPESDGELPTLPVNDPAPAGR